MACGNPMCFPRPFSPFNPLTLGPKSTPAPTCQSGAADFSVPGRSKDRFYRFLDAPRPNKKSSIFQPLPKSTPDLKKSTLGRPRLHFSWISIDLGDHFGIMFRCFCKMPKPSNLLYRAANFKVFNIFVHPFVHQFCINFHVFSGTLPGSTF